jgi:hypothetical protein
MEWLEQLVELLQKGGPWTITAICMLITRHFYQELRVTQVAAAKEKQELNDRLIQMTVKQVEVLTISNENQKHLIEAVKLLEG